MIGLAMSVDAAEPHRGDFQLQDGDTVVFDIPARSLRVELSDGEIRSRMEKWKAPAPRYATGVLAKYARLVGTGSKGAVTD